MIFKLINKIRSNIDDQKIKINDEILVSYLKDYLNNKYNIDNITDYNFPHKEVEFYESNDALSECKTPFSILTNNMSLTALYYLRYNIFNKTITDIKELEKRQNIIDHYRQYIIKQQQNSDPYHQLVDFFKNNEKELYWFIKPVNEQLDENISNLYFNSKLFSAINKLASLNINENDKILNIYYFFIMLISPIWGLISPLLFFIFPYFISKYIFKVNLPFKQYYETFKGTLFGNNIFNSINQMLQLFIVKKIVGGSDEEKRSLFTKIKLFFVAIISKIVNSNWIRYIYLGFMILGYLWSVYTSYIISNNYYKLIQYIFNKMKLFANLLINTKSVFNLTNKIPSLPESVIDFNKKIKNYLSDEIIQNFINSYKPFLSKKYNVLSNKGIILSLYFKYNSISKNIIDDIISYNGLIEMYYSLSKNISANKMTKSVYLEKKQPQLFIYKLNNIAIDDYQRL